MPSSSGSRLAGCGRYEHERIGRFGVEQAQGIACGDDEPLLHCLPAQITDGSRERCFLQIRREVDHHDVISQRRKAIRPSTPRVERQFVGSIVKEQDCRSIRLPFDTGDNISTRNRNRKRPWFSPDLVQLTPHPSCLYFFAQSTPCQVFIEIGLTKKSHRGSVNVGIK